MRKMKLFIKKNGSILIVFMLLLAICMGFLNKSLLDNITEVTYLNYIQLLTNVLTIVGVFIALFSLWSTKDTNKGQFILGLQEDFATGGYGIEIYSKCWKQYEKEEEWTAVAEKDKQQIVNYLTFFESLYIMYEKGILSMDELDDLFGRRFFVVINNVTIQAELNSEYYKNIYCLYEEWTKYRIKKNRMKRTRKKDDDEEKEKLNKLLFCDKAQTRSLIDVDIKFSFLLCGFYFCSIKFK